MHTYLQQTSYLLKILKEGVNNGPVHGPPLQARVAAANGTVLAACKLLALTDNKSPALTNDPGAHGHGTGGQSKMKQMNGRGQSKMNGGKMLMRAVGMAGKDGKAGKTQPAEQSHCRRTQPADSPPGTGLTTNSPQLAGLAARTTAAADDVG